MSHDDVPSALQRYFAGLAEQTFESQLGLADPPLVDYVTQLLLRFLRVDVGADGAEGGQRPEAISGLLLRAQQARGQLQRELFRHAGDHALFWTGVYPEAVQRRGALALDPVAEFREQGKRSYYLASTLRDEASDARCDLYERLSRDFDLCVYGLNELRREWERPGGNGGGSMLLPG